MKWYPVTGKRRPKPLHTVLLSVDGLVRTGFLMQSSRDTFFCHERGPVNADAWMPAPKAFKVARRDGDGELS